MHAGRQCLPVLEYVVYVAVPDADRRQQSWRLSVVACSQHTAVVQCFLHPMQALPLCRHAICGISCCRQAVYQVCVQQIAPLAIWHELARREVLFYPALVIVYVDIYSWRQIWADSRDACAYGQLWQLHGNRAAAAIVCAYALQSCPDRVVRLPESVSWHWKLPHTRHHIASPLP